MPISRKQAKPKSRLWGWLTSIRLTVSLLLILAAVAVIGTVLPQDQPAGFYQRYGEVWSAIIWRGGLDRIYFSIWFLAPVSLLALNILSCIVHGLPQAIRRSSQPFTWEAALALPERARFSWPKGIDPRVPVSRNLAPGTGPPPAPIRPGPGSLFP